MYHIQINKATPMTKAICASLASLGCPPQAFTIFYFKKEDIISSKCSKKVLFHIDRLTSTIITRCLHLE